MSKKSKKKNPSRPRPEDLANLTMSLKDESDRSKALRHPELIP